MRWEVADSRTGDDETVVGEQLSTVYVDDSDVLDDERRLWRLCCQSRREETIGEQDGNQGGQAHRSDLAVVASETPLGDRGMPNGRPTCRHHVTFTRWTFADGRQHTANSGLGSLPRAPSNCEGVPYTVLVNAPSEPVFSGRAMRSAGQIPSDLAVPRAGCLRGRLSVTDPCAGDRVSSASEIVYPSPEHRTLQSAVCAVAAGGSIHVLTGTYDERVTIWGKYVAIRGAGNDEKRTEWPVLRAAVPSGVIAARSAAGVISVGGGGSLSLTMVRIAGGDAGILVDETSGPVDVKHARFEDNGRGILHFASAALSIKHTTFTGQLWNAISFVPFDLTAQNCGGLFVSHAILGSTGNAGIYVRGCFHTIEHTAIDHAQGSGIVAIASVVTIRQVRITYARYFGIFLINTAAHVEDTSIDFTKAGPLAPDPDPVYGDAVSLWTTNASWVRAVPAGLTRTTTGPAARRHAPCRRPRRDGSDRGNRVGTRG